MKFRKKPVVIEAVQFTQDWIERRLFDGAELPEGIVMARASYHKGNRVVYSSKFVIETREGKMEVSPGDWVIKGIAGEFYPCKPDIFDQTYESVVEIAAEESLPSSK